MKTESPRHLRNPLLALLFLAAAAASAAQIAMAAEPEQQAPAAQEAAVHIVYVDRPEDADPEEFHIRTLAPVLGSEEKARGAVLYHYKHAASGFSAKLTTEQSNQVSFRLCRARPTSSMDMRVDMPAQRAQWALCESLE
ncbi:subtilisin-like protease SBT3.3 isoform X2 [Triticum aestivum]|uniref:subtilisin-like protease SBT3.3 isoform X2 n=1 Tax=Triticum aestivum TaxID=4565 RepID=UPI001D02F0A3|nr:subtilisin-like protease SBT3.3 isoform X2 [Triticum aestivum]